MAIIGAGAIGCEFADFYNAVGTEVTLIEMLPQLLPNRGRRRLAAAQVQLRSAGINVYLETKTEKVEKTADGRAAHPLAANSRGTRLSRPTWCWSRSASPATSKAWLHPRPGSSCSRTA